MRPLRTTNGEEVGGCNLMGKISLVPAAQEAWNAWEIHCMMLLSLFLQVFLFLFAGMRKRSTSGVLRSVLWLTYLSADSVAIFVLGHLAVHASEPRHQLMSFWAPFVLVHLGGQDSITAFSKQDNELWTRHLLSLVSQVVVAGYVVAKASWPDHRLKAAMVLIFLNGCFKYTERTACLYFASPARLGSSIMNSLLSNLRQLQDSQKPKSESEQPTTNPTHDIDMLLEGTGVSSSDIMSVDAPLNEARAISVLDHLPNMFLKFLSSADHYGPYKSVGARLGYWYKRLYTKGQLRDSFCQFYLELFQNLATCPPPCSCPYGFDVSAYSAWVHLLLSILLLIIITTITSIIVGPVLTLMILYPLFQSFSTPIALVLFTAAEKGDRLRTSQADIIVSYVLLVGAIVLDVSSSIISIFSFMTSRNHSGMIKRAISQVADYIQPAWIRKQWSEELAQYNMIKRHSMQDTNAAMAAARQWIRKILGSWGIELFDITHTSISKVDAPIKEFILDNLLLSGTRKEWNVASSRGQLAVQNWMKSHQDPDSARIGNELEKIIASGTDFPTTVLIWHIATDICYYFGDNPGIDSLQMKKHKQMSRELSNYIMYLVFKCGVMLTTNSKLLHDRAHDEISAILSDQQIAEKAAVVKLFDAMKEEEQQDQTTVDIEKHEEPADNNNSNGDSHVQVLVQSAEATTLPVLPRACLVAKKLISINDETERWGLIADVWSEMLYYAAPRCGCAFHYEHLSTGGEFITHVLLLMKFLGPFLPPPGA